jgi:hypothetical protein
MPVSRKMESLEASYRILIRNILKSNPIFCCLSSTILQKESVNVKEFVNPTFEGFEPSKGAVILDDF